MPTYKGERRNPEYYAARRALAQHMHRHHEQGWCDGTLAARISQHDDLHFLLKQRGKEATHTHAELAEGETLLAVAHRYLREGSDG